MKKFKWREVFDNEFLVGQMAERPVGRMRGDGGTVWYEIRKGWCSNMWCRGDDASDSGLRDEWTSKEAAMRHVERFLSEKGGQ